MTKKAISSPVDLLVERIVLFFRLLGVSAGAVPAVPVDRKPGLDVGVLRARILGYLEHMARPVRKTDILHHIGKQATLDAINEALTFLVKQGQIVGATVARGQGRPAQMWSLVESRRTVPVAVIRTKAGKHGKIARQVKQDIVKRTERAMVAKEKAARVARENRAKVAKLVKAKLATAVEVVPKTVKSLTVPELGEKVWSFMRRHRRPMNRQVISGHLGHKVPAKRINACLAHLKRRGKATDRVVTNGSGRPAVLWAIKS